MLDKIESKAVHKDKEGDRKWKKKQDSEVKPVKNKSKNLLSFLEISSVQKEVLLPRNLWDHMYEY